MNLFLLFFASFLPNIANASFDSFLKNVNSSIVNPLIRLLFAVGIAYFLYGAFLFLKNADNETVRTEGKNHMLYGLIGLTVMMGVWGILNFVLNTLDIKGINPEKGTVKLEKYTPSSPFTGPGNGNTNTGNNVDPVLNVPNLDPGPSTVPDTDTGTTGFEPVDDNFDPSPVGPSGFEPVISTPGSVSSVNQVSNVNTNTSVPSTPSGFEPVGPSTTIGTSLPSNPTSSTTNTSQTQTFAGDALTE